MLFGAWTAAGTLGYLIGGVLSTLLALVLNWLEQFGAAPGRYMSALAMGAAFGLVITSFQFAVFRVVLGIRSAAVTAWVAVTLLVSMAEDFVMLGWFAQASDGVGIALTVLSALVLGLTQGFLLSEMLRTRHAVWIWLLGTLVVVGGQLVLVASGFLNPFTGDNVPAALVAGNGILGVEYGAVTAIFLVLSVWVAGKSGRTVAVSPVAIDAQQRAPH